MEADYAYGAHFALRVLVLPVAPIRAKEYERQLALLRRHSKIALADIPPTTTAGESIHPLISPTPASRGFLNLNFVETWDADLAWLNEYQVSRRVLGVVGLFDCAEWTGQNSDGDLQDGARAFRELSNQEAPANVFATRCYAFNPRENQNDNAEGLVVIPNVGDLDFYINTLLAELASNMLAGVSSILGALDSKTNVQMPMGRLVFPSIPTYQQATSPSTPSNESRMSLSAFGSGSFDRSNSPLPSLPPTRPSSVAPLSGSPGGNGESSDAKARKKHPGRIAKLRGDLLCLAGKHQEAILSYNEATVIARAQNDYAWQAAAIEANIMTQTYQSWVYTAPSGSTLGTPRSSISSTTASRHEPSSSSPVNNLALAKDLPSRYFDALSLYTRSTGSGRSSANISSDGQGVPLTFGTATTDADAVIHPLLYIESCMRCLRMQLALLFRGNAWDAVTANMLIGNSSKWPEPSAIDLFKRGLYATVTRSDAGATILLAYSQSRSSSLRKEDRIQALEVIAHVYDALHLPRRKATILREIAAIVSTDIARSEVQAMEMDLAADASAVQGATAVMSKGDAEGSAKVFDIMRSVCRTYGLPDPLEEASNKPSVLPSESISVLLNTIFERFGWLELQYALVKEAIRVSEVRQDVAGALSFTLLALRSTLDAIASKEQRIYLDEVRRLNSEAAKANLNEANKYWGPEYPLLSMQILSLPAPLRVVEQLVKSDAAEQAATGNQGFSDLLVHSVVRSQVAGGADSAVPTIIEGEPGEISLRLYNPYSVALQIDSITLLGSGVRCAAFPPVSVTLPPLCTQAVTIICTPVEAGELVIKGCNIRIAGCPARDFLIPTNTASIGDELLRAMGLLLLEESRSKHTDFNTWLDTKKQLLQGYNEETHFTFLTCKVVPKQPLLRLAELKPAHGFATLYEGEVSTVRLALANASDVQINSLTLEFEDNVTSYQKSRLTGEGTSPLMAYELEVDMRQPPVLKSKGNEAEIDIAPDGTYSVEVDCYGKPGLSQGSVQFEYANLPLNTGATRIDRFYTRQLQVPFAFSVLPCLRCHSWNALSVSRYSASAKRQHRRSLSTTSVERGPVTNEEFEDIIKDLDDETHCLLILKVENLSSTKAFEAVFTVSESLSAKATKRIEPSTTIDMLLPIKKIRLSEEHVSQPIPCLSSRQFVVGKGVLLPSELERFWYREEILRSVGLAWQEVDSMRTGDCNLRHIAFSDGMLSAVKLSDLPLTLEVSQNEEKCTQDDKDRWCVQEGAFIELFISLKNLKARSLTMTAQIAPRNPYSPHQIAHYQGIANDPVARNVVVDGSSIVTLSPLSAGEETGTPIFFSLSFLSKGIFSIQVVVEEVLDDEIHVGSIARARTESLIPFNVS